MWDERRGSGEHDRLDDQGRPGQECVPQHRGRCGRTRARREPELARDGAAVERKWSVTDAGDDTGDEHRRARLQRTPSRRTNARSQQGNESQHEDGRKQRAEREQEPTGWLSPEHRQQRDRATETNQQCDPHRCA